MKITDIVTEDDLQPGQMSPFAKGFVRPSSPEEMGQWQAQHPNAIRPGGSDNMGGVPPGRQQQFIGRPSGMPNPSYNPNTGGYPSGPQAPTARPPESYPATPTPVQRP